MKLKKNALGEWQLCPKCNGNGLILNSGISTSITRLCDVCNGAKIIAKPIIKNDTN